MEDYLFKYTEKVIIATRHGEMELDKILDELEALLKNKPENASEGMIKYLEFLILVAKGEKTEEAFNQLDQNLQELFGKVIEKFKGANINNSLKEITRKTILASKAAPEEKDEVLNELLSIQSSKPEGGSESVTNYIAFLIDIVKGTDKPGAINLLDQNLADLFTSELKDIFEPDMMKFFVSLTEMAFKGSQSEDEKDKAHTSINELLKGTDQPPVEIKKYLELLLCVTEGTFNKGMKEVIAQEFLEIFNEVEKNYQ